MLAVWRQTNRYRKPFSLALQGDGDGFACCAKLSLQAKEPLPVRLEPANGNKDIAGLDPRSRSRALCHHALHDCFAGRPMEVEPAAVLITRVIEVSPFAEVEEAGGEIEGDLITRQQPKAQSARSARRRGISSFDARMAPFSVLARVHRMRCCTLSAAETTPHGRLFSTCPTRKRALKTSAPRFPFPTQPVSTSNRSGGPLSHTLPPIVGTFSVILARVKSKRLSRPMSDPILECQHARAEVDANDVVLQEIHAEATADVQRGRN